MTDNNQKMLDFFGGEIPYETLTDQEVYEISVKIIEENIVAYEDLAK